MKEFELEDQAEKIMPTWSYWGSGVILIKKEQWYKSRKRTIAILKHLRRAKKRLKEK